MFPNGEQKVLLNHRHAKTRTRATLAEELAHIHIGHPASLLVNDTDGTFIFNYNATHEDEAYWVGAAALATREQLQKAQKLRLTIQSFAKFGGISPAIVRFRCNKTGICLPEELLDKRHA